MGKYLLKLPKMGESVSEATLTAWLKDVGDTIAIDDIVVEVATDKVDSDVPSEYTGVLLEKKFTENDVIQVGETIAVIETKEEIDSHEEIPLPAAAIDLNENAEESLKEIVKIVEAPLASPSVESHENDDAERKTYFSPLVKNIAAKEGITQEELSGLKGTGEKGRVTKNDVLHYLDRRLSKAEEVPVQETKSTPLSPAPSPSFSKPSIQTSGQDQIIEMSRMGKMIADHMIESKKTAAHVQSFVEADLTELWDWRERVKGNFQKREGEKLTFTPIFMQAVIQAIKDFPLLNSSVNGNQILQKKDINIGMATALGDGNLIVPVIKNADHLNLVGLAKAVNDLSLRARNNQLLPDEVQGGTYTVTNIGNFGSITGTPIINQPQVGILALGVIRKMPAVIETSDGDFVGIRKKMILSHSYDHRIINGAMGGQFVRKVADYLENWDTTLDF